MQAVVLVGGEGTRLRPLTYGTPKPMVPLFGVPFLERTLSRLHQAGIDDVILAAGYLPKAIAEHLGDGSRLGMKLTYIIEEAPLGTAGAIRNVEQHLKGAFFVLNGDVLTSLDLERMLAYHKEKNGLGVLHLIRVEDPSAFGCVVHDADGRISSFVEKPQRDEAPTNEINAGTYLLEPGVLQVIAPGRSVSIERETFPMLLASGAPLYAYTTDDYWLDLGRPDQYLKAHRDVLDGSLTLGPTADPGAHQGTFWRSGDQNIPAGVRPPVFLSKATDLAPDAIAGPYTVLGSGTRLGRGAEVSDSILWNDVAIGPRARVTGSILASNVHVGGAANIGNGSVIGHDAVIEAEAEIAPHSRISATQAPHA